MSKESIGSIIGAFTNIIIPAPIRTAIHHNTSSSKWRETTFSFILSPFLRRKAAIPFIIIPKIANSIIHSGLGCSGESKRDIASCMIKTLPIISTIEFIKAPTKEKRLYP